ncbi:hypothetical protein [Metapseudomonas otitidis]|uniref:hypothetical protein n=1 Tax=Metapseudomonas otitidis TaxID=319939 RepID=UPI001552BBD3|nr:hypothetical protein [Pseudomonas otitidis]
MIKPIQRASGLTVETHFSAIFRPEVRRTLGSGPGFNNCDDLPQQGVVRACKTGSGVGVAECRGVACRLVGETQAWWSAFSVGQHPMVGLKTLSFAVVC